MTESDEKQKRGFRDFWTARVRTVAAVLLVAVIAIVGLVAVTGGSSEDPAQARWVRQANKLCSQATDRYRRIGRVYITTYRRVVPAIARNERALARGLRALEAPEGERDSIGRLISLIDQQAHEVDGAAATYGALSGAFTYESHVKRATRLDGEIAVVARSLGAGACAQPPVRTPYL